MLSALVGCGFLSGEACSVVAVGDFAGGDGGLWNYGGELDGSGDFSDGRDRKGASGGWILAGGVICYIVLLVISNLVFHRMVTTELFLIVGWAVLNLVTVNVLYTSGLFSYGISIAFCVLTLAVVVGSLYCYMIYYKLEKWKGYIDGFLPLVMVGIAMLLMVAVMFYEK